MVSCIFSSLVFEESLLFLEHLLAKGNISALFSSNKKGTESFLSLRLLCSIPMLLNSNYISLTICRLFPNGEGGNGLESTDKPAAPVHPFHPKIVVRRRVLAAECADTMQHFFQLRRRKDKKPEPTTPPSCLPISHHPSKFLTKMHHVFHVLFCL